MKIGVDASMLTRPKFGIGHYVTSLLPHLQSLQADWQFVLYANAPLSETVVPKSFKLSVKNNRIRPLWMQTDLARQLSADKPHLFWGGNYALPLLPRRLKKVVTIHDFVFRRYPETLPLSTVKHLGLMMPLYLRSADHVLVDSQNTAKDLHEYYSYPENQVTVTELAARYEFFIDQKPDDLADTLSKYGLKSGYLLYVGTVEPRKGLVTIFEALSIYREKYRTCPVMVIVGKFGWKTEEILSALERLSLENSVIFLDYVVDSDLPALYRGAALFIYPSFYEGFGLPILEAMASGLPVITTTSSSLPEVGGSVAQYFEAGDAGKLAVLIETVLSDQTMQKELALKGRARAREFSWQQSARQVVAVFKQVLKESS